MNKLKYLGVAFMAMLACVNLTSCSDDDEDNPGPGVVEPGTGRKLKAIYYERESAYGGGVEYEFGNPQWNGDRLISFCDGNEQPEEDERMSITYLDGNKAEIRINPYDHEPAIVTLNEQGYAQSIDFGYSSIYTFIYNDNGQLISWRGSEGDNEYCNIHYTSDGDISRIDGSYSGDNTVAYTNSTVTTPIENKGGIMLMAEWGIMWDYEYFYWFGIYGAATKHLPVQVGNVTCDWTLDNQGYPTVCEITGLDYADKLTYHFEWE